MKELKQHEQNLLKPFWELAQDELGNCFKETLDGSILLEGSKPAGEPLMLPYSLQRAYQRLRGVVRPPGSEAGKWSAFMQAGVAKRKAKKARVRAKAAWASAAAERARSWCTVNN